MAPALGFPCAGSFYELFFKLSLYDVGDVSNIVSNIWVM